MGIKKNIAQYSRMATMVLALPALTALGLYAYTAQHPIRGGISGCDGVRQTPARRACFTEVFRTMAKRDGIDRALAKVEAISERDDVLMSDCHMSWHPVGTQAGAAIARAGKRLPEVPSAQFCSAGYGHGLRIGYQTHTPSKGISVRERVERACLDSVDNSKLPNCVHSWGHVFSRENPRNVTAAVGNCNTAMAEKINAAYTDPVGAPFECMYGLFMERTLADQRNGVDRRNDCAGAPKESLVACFAFLPARVGGMTDDLRDSAKACHDYPPTVALRDVCISSFVKGSGKDVDCTLLVTRDEQRSCKGFVQNPLSRLATIIGQTSDGIKLRDTHSGTPAPGHADGPAPVIESADDAATDSHG